MTGLPLHHPVLREEVVSALVGDLEGTYVDATFGQGGHSRAILARLNPGGTLVGLDRDPLAAHAAQQVSDPRFTFRGARFSELPKALRDLGITHIAGLLLDLGVSSPQIDQPLRGFSFRNDGPLDMRMDPNEPLSAADWIRDVEERQLGEVLARYGEERFAKSIARAIVTARSEQPIVSTRQLAGIVAQAIRTRQRPEPGQDPATRTFQAIRIFLNQELEELSLVLHRAMPLLGPQARLAVISFHSLEDRITKQFMRAQAQPETMNPELARLPLRHWELPVPTLRLIGRAIKPNAAELALNPRARSAVLRIAERINV